MVRVLKDKKKLIELIRNNGESQLLFISHVPMDRRLDIGAEVLEQCRWFLMHKIGRDTDFFLVLTNQEPDFSNENIEYVSIYYGNKILSKIKNPTKDKIIKQLREKLFNH